MVDLNLPGYRIVRELGRGGMATVYLAIQENFDREVALKVMSQDRVSDDDTSGKRFLREARIVAQLSHPNIVQVYDVGQHDGHYFLAMEYLTEGELNRRLQLGLDIQEIFRITKDIARALHFAHAKGYIHRDIKPENILFREEGSAVLSDFGIARAAEQHEGYTIVGAAIGTPHYMSPEQAEGSADLDGRSDLYSLGVVFYKMVTGSVPFDADSPMAIGVKHITDPIPALAPHLEVFQPLVDRFLSKSPDQRFQTGLEIIESIERMEQNPQLPNAFMKTEIIGTAEIAAVRRTSVEQTGNRGAVNTEAWSGVHQADEKPTSPLGWLLGGILFAALSGLAVYATLFDGMPVLVNLYHQYTAAPAAEQSTQTVPNPPSANSQGAQSNSQSSGTDPAGRAQSTSDVGNQSITSVPAAGIGTSIPSVTGPELVSGNSRTDSLLRQAQALMLSDALMEPPGENAFAKFQQVLAVDPNNATAQAGLQQIADAMHRNAQAAIAQQDLETASNLIQRGLLSVPNHPGLNAARSELSSLRDNKASIDELLADAQEYLRRDALTTPSGANAVDAFNAVLSIDPANQDAKAGIDRVVGRLAQLAQNALDAQDMSRAERLVGRGRQIDRNNARLATVASAIERSQSAKRNAESLVREAGALLDQGKVSRPAGSNAYEKAVTARQLAPNSSSVNNMATRVAERLAEIAREAEQYQLSEQARRYYSLALELNPSRREWREANARLQ